MQEEIGIGIVRRATSGSRLESPRGFDPSYRNRQAGRQTFPPRPHRVLVPPLSVSSSVCSLARCDRRSVQYDRYSGQGPRRSRPPLQGQAQARAPGSAELPPDRDTAASRKPSSHSCGLPFDVLEDITECTATLREELELNRVRNNGVRSIMLHTSIFLSFSVLNE